jgi:hypothetical protein
MNASLGRLDDLVGRAAGWGTDPAALPATGPDATTQRLRAGDLGSLNVHGALVHSGSLFDPGALDLNGSLCSRGSLA